MKKTAILTCGFVLLVSSAQAGDWRCYRGPDHNGISKETGWSTDWPKSGPPVAWKASVGLGFSSFVVADGKAFTTGNADNKDSIYCFDAATGKEVWKHSYEASRGATFYQGGTTGTPTYFEGKLYQLSRWGDLFCLDAANGKLVWSRNIKKDDKLPLPMWGFTGSPRVHGKLLLVTAGKAGLAVDKDTGKPVWVSDAEIAGYTTPVLYEKEGQTLAIFSSGKAFAAVDVKSGKPVWETRWLTRYGVNAADPILADNDQLFIASGYNKGNALFDISKNPPRQLWKNQELRTQLSPAVLVDGHLYGFDGDTTGRATFRCLDLKTGKVLWTEKDMGNGGVMVADGKLIVLSGKGELMVAPVSPKEFKPIARAKVLGGKCWAVPVLANGLIYCRNGAGEVIVVDVRKK